MFDVIQILNDFYVSVSGILFPVLSASFVLLSALIGLGWGVQKLLFHLDGSTNWLGSKWSWYDHLTYKPYKNYNRFHSRQWNIEHTLE